MKNKTLLGGNKIFLVKILLLVLEHFGQDEVKGRGPKYCCNAKGIEP